MFEEGKGGNWVEVWKDWYGEEATLTFRAGVDCVVSFDNVDRIYPGTEDGYNKAVGKLLRMGFRY